MKKERLWAVVKKNLLYKIYNDILWVKIKEYVLIISSIQVQTQQQFQTKVARVK